VCVCVPPSLTLSATVTLSAMSSQTYTKTFLFDIFPSLAAALPNEVLDIIFPVQTQELCPTPTLLLSSIPIRWPNLLLLCPIGALIGFLCSRPLSKTSPLYSSSFFFFGVMNTTAFLTHCYFPQHTKAWEVTYALDMVATSTASFYLMLAVWVESMGRENPCPSLFVKYYFCNAFVLQYLEIQHAGTGWWIAEILYIGVTGAAAIVGIVGLVCRTKVYVKPHTHATHLPHTRVNKGGGGGRESVPLKRASEAHLIFRFHLALSLLALD